MDRKGDILGAKLFPDRQRSAHGNISDHGRSFSDDKQTLAQTGVVDWNWTKLARLCGVGIRDRNNPH